MTMFYTLADERYVAEQRARREEEERLRRIIREELRLASGRFSLLGWDDDTSKQPGSDF